MSQYTTVLLLGTNLGDKKKNLLYALEQIKEDIGEITYQTSSLETEPVGYKSSNTYLNQAVEVKTPLSPIKLLKALKKIERSMGRTVDSTDRGYSDRTIDIDVVYYDKLRFTSAVLSLPHKAHTQEREFSKVLLTELQAVKTL